MPPASSAAKGLAAVALVTAAAEASARFVTDAHGQARLPAVIAALAMGALAGNVLRPAGLGPGLDLVKKRVLRAAIILFGLGITAGNVRSAGLAVVALVALCLVVSLLLAAVAGRLLGASPKSRLLIGCGTAICGATAVVTIAPLIDADDDDVGFAVATIFLFNIVALVTFPAIGHAMAMTATSFGAWVGTAVNDTSAVVATGRAFSSDAGAFATLVKVLRTLALVPMAVVVGLLHRGAGGARRVSIARIFPWFVLGFAATAALAVLAPLPGWLVAAAKLVAGILITSVLAAVGLHLDMKKALGTGARSLLLGFTIAAAMALVSFALVGRLGIR